MDTDTPTDTGHTQGECGQWKGCGLEGTWMGTSRAVSHAEVWTLTAWEVQSHGHAETHGLLRGEGCRQE